MYYVGKADSALSEIPGSSLEKSHFWWKYPCGGLVTCWMCCGLRPISSSRWSLSIQRRKLPTSSNFTSPSYPLPGVVSCCSGQLSKTEGRPLIVLPSVECLLPIRQGWPQFWLSKRMAASAGFFCFVLCVFFSCCFFFF